MIIIIINKYQNYILFSTLFILFYSVLLIIFMLRGKKVSNKKGKNNDNYHWIRIYMPFSIRYKSIILLLYLDHAIYNWMGPEVHLLEFYSTLHCKKICCSSSYGLAGFILQSVNFFFAQKVFYFYSNGWKN